MTTLRKRWARHSKTLRDTQGYLWVSLSVFDLPPKMGRRFQVDAYSLKAFGGFKLELLLFSSFMWVKISRMWTKIKYEVSYFERSVHHHELDVKTLRIEHGEGRFLGFQIDKLKSKSGPSLLPVTHAEAAMLIRHSAKITGPISVWTPSGLTGGVGGCHALGGCHAVNSLLNSSRVIYLGFGF